MTDPCIWGPGDEEEEEEFENSGQALEAGLEQIYGTPEVEDEDEKEDETEDEKEKKD